MWVSSVSHAVVVLRTFIRSHERFTVEKYKNVVDYRVIIHSFLENRLKAAFSLQKKVEKRMNFQTEMRCEEAAGG